jgi:hypothetical protein
MPFYFILIELNFRLSQALGSTNVDYLSLPGDGGGSGGQVPHGVPLARAVLDRLGVPAPHQPHQQLSQVRDVLESPRPSSMLKCFMGHCHGSRKFLGPPGSGSVIICTDPDPDPSISTGKQKKESKP